MSSALRAFARVSHVRSFSTVRPLMEAAKASAAAYPFATNVVTRTHTPFPEKSLRPTPPTTKHPARGVMARVDAQLTQQQDPNEDIARLFSRRSPEAVRPGSIVLVETWLSANKTSSTTFAGVLIAIRRAGIATSFVLRNLANKLGVEVRFSAYSPMIKQIRVIQRADLRKGESGPGLLRARRAKLYYMSRRVDRRVNSVAGVLKQFRAAEQAREEKVQAVKPKQQTSRAGGKRKGRK
ncbi:hypothetical protein MCUN1_002016 [Malassezia cuniculi]|uniref:50S ribosomal protein L19 n=1 Tax=Malassezia cuniculi TaxID=948313 RepID=A0AAF0ERC1_9BASI|nr:hypothetical protein MCUN1_002016 [Malassezia cuniculi]